MDNLSGRYVEDPIYHVDAKAVEHFDHTFPAKVRVSGTPTQQRLLELLAQEKTGVLKSELAPFLSARFFLFLVTSVHSPNKKAYLL